MVSALKENKILLLFTGHSCNNNCIFCSVDSLNNAHINRPTEEIARNIVLESKRYRSIEFIGGEFSIRKDALFLIGLAKKYNFQGIFIETNGRMFALDGFCQKAIEAGLTHIGFSIHGAHPETHDQITRVNGSFEQSFRGLKNADQFDISIHTNYVITKHNYKEIPQFMDKINKLKHLEFALFSVVRPVETLSDIEAKNIMPLFSEVTPFLKKIEKNKKVRFQFIPLCALDSRKHFSQTEKKNIEKNYSYEKDHADVYSSLESEFIKPPVCSGCRKKGNCLGILKRYLDFFPSERGVYGPA